MINLEPGQTLKNIIESTDKTILLDFWATWCMPCKMLSKVLDEISGDYEDRLQIVKIDLEDHPELAAQYSVRSVPTLIMLRDGYPSSTHIGAGAEKVIRRFIENELDG